MNLPLNEGGTAPGLGGPRGGGGACLVLVADVTRCCAWSAVSIVVGKSSRRCFWMPSPGPMCEMWLKLVGAEISFERRSVLLRLKQDITCGKCKCKRTTYVRIVLFPDSRNENRRFVLTRPSRSADCVLISSPGSIKDGKQFNMQCQ